MGDIKAAFDRDPNLKNLLFDDFFRQAMQNCLPHLRELVKMSIDHGIPTPALSSALSFYDGYRLENLPANLLQAQRDYFGAHTFEYLDNPGTFHHFDWTSKL